MKSIKSFFLFVLFSFPTFAAVGDEEVIGVFFFDASSLFAPSLYRFFLKENF